MSFQDLQDDHSSNQLAFEQPLDFLDEMLPTLPPYPWSDLNSSNQNLLNPRPSTDQYRFDDSALLASEFQADGSDAGNSSAAKSAGVKLLHQMLLARGDSGSGNLVETARTSPSATAGLGICSLPLSLVNDTMDRQQNDVVELASFKCISSVTGEDGSMQASCKRFAGPVNATGRTWSQPRFHSPQNFGAAGGVMNQAPASGSIGAAQVQSKQKVRARRGKATDPHSIAERLRRERISERMKALQELFPNANKTDKGSMLDEIIEYVKFLQLQVKVLSMSRLGGAEAVPDVSYQANGWLGRSPDGNRTVTMDDVMTVTELRVAKLMEEDVGSAMQYLQEKGLCLMPVSLATLISAATCYSRRTLLPSPTVDGTPSPRHAHPHRSVS